MKNVSIEELVTWAYRDQMVHAARGQGVPAELTLSYSPGMAQLHLSGGPVSSSVKTDFEAAPDAYVVHAAVMALGTVERPFSDEEKSCLFARWSVAGDLRAGQEREVLADHHTIRERMFGAKPERVHLPSLVFEWAMRGRRPEWHPAPVYAWERRGTIYRGRNHAIARMVDPVGDDPLEVERDRAIYGLWALALAGLGDSLAKRGKLKAHGLGKPAPSAAPWARTAG